ncbi:MAG: hypothetical protein ABFD92_16785 [Planctomycetaceae bacterium]|nr:hypothetical protein [Planctomycetaceae bacterium]
MDRPTTQQQLWGFIAHHFGLKLPWKSFTAGHSNPFAFVADAYFNPGQDLAAWANRSGIKTLSASVVAALDFRFNTGLLGRVLSGSQDQANNLYGYWAAWCRGVLADVLQGEPTITRTAVNGGSFAVLAASQKRVRGPKIQRLFNDELDEMDPELLEASVGMMAGRPDTPSRTIYDSTWHRPAGPMGKLIDGCPANGVRLHRWNIWEALANCPPDRHQNGRGCAICPLGDCCVEKARQFHQDNDRNVGIAAECCGLLTIEDAVKFRQRMSARMWDAEILCKRPSSEGLVWPEFDPQVHACPRPPADLKIYRSIDWGHGVFVCLWIGQDKDGAAYVLDTYQAEAGTIHEHARYIQSHAIKSVVETYCDPAGRNRSDQTGKSNVDVFAQQYAIRCTYTLAPAMREVRNGIEMVRGLLAPASGPPRLMFVPSANNAAFVRAMQSYHNRKVNNIWLDEPADPQEFEHIPDALRYFVVNRQKPRTIGVKRLGAA